MAMGSPPTGILRPPRLTMTRRKPLQPKNPPAVPAAVPDPAKPEKRQKKLPAAAPIKASEGKENCSFPAAAAAEAEAEVAGAGREVEVEVGSPMEVSLAEELGAARRRVERLRSERERTERVLREMDLVMETEVRNVERRWQEQRIVEAEIGRLFRGRKHVGLGQKPCPVKSLREKEEERKNRESQAQEIKSDKVDIIRVGQDNEQKTSKEVEQNIDNIKDGDGSREKHKDSKESIEEAESSVREESLAA